MFLQPVKVKRFVDNPKKYGNPPFNGMNRIRCNYRILRFTENKNPDDIYYVVGVTNMKEGYSEYMGQEEGCIWVQKNSHKVYIVAKGLGRRFKVLESDLVNLNIGVDLSSGNDWTVVK